MSEQPDLSDLIQALDRLTIAVASNGAARDQWEVVEGEAAAAAAPTEEQRLAAVAFGDYESFAELLPPCPAHLYALCRRLRGSDFSAEFRAERAWEAGFWAKLTLQGRLSKPRATISLGSLKSTVYVVLRSRRVREPTRVSTASDLFRLVGRLEEDSSAVCHGFPSLAEAEVYCAAAGSALPPQHQWQHQRQ